MESIACVPNYYTVKGASTCFSPDQTSLATVPFPVPASRQHSQPDALLPTIPTSPSACFQGLLPFFRLLNSGAQAGFGTSQATTKRKTKPRDLQPFPRSPRATITCLLPTSPAPFFASYISIVASASQAPAAHTKKPQTKENRNHVQRRRPHVTRAKRGARRLRTPESQGH